MSTITAGALIDRASDILQDLSNVRWTRSELLKWFNDGQRDLVTSKPNAYTQHAATKLALGTKQTLPVDAASLIDIPRNVGGEAVRIVSREMLDAHSPGWHTAPVARAIRHYMYSPLEPKVFYVYPPSNGIDVNVELVYVGIPPDIAEGAVMLVDDVYATALTNYILYRAYSKDAEYAANAQLAGVYYQQFTALVGVKVAAEGATQPSQTVK